MGLEQKEKKHDMLSLWRKKGNKLLEQENINLYKKHHTLAWLWFTNFGKSRTVDHVLEEEESSRFTRQEKERSTWELEYNSSID
jgi:hypothetical protein